MTTPPGRPRGRQVPDPPDFRNSTDLRIYLEDFRKAMHMASMLAHQGSAEIAAALSTIQPADRSQLFSRSVARRRARRVARHLDHAAECMVAASAAAVRCWGAFRTEYAPELSPAPRKRSTFKIDPE